MITANIPQPVDDEVIITSFIQIGKRFGVTSSRFHAKHLEPGNEKMFKAIMELIADIDEKAVPAVQNMDEDIINSGSRRFARTYDISPSEDKARLAAAGSVHNDLPEHTKPIMCFFMTDTTPELSQVEKDAQFVRDRRGPKPERETTTRP